MADRDSADAMPEKCVYEDPADLLRHIDEVGGRR